MKTSLDTDWTELSTVTSKEPLAYFRPDGQDTEDVVERLLLVGNAGDQLRYAGPKFLDDKNQQLYSTLQGYLVDEITPESEDSQLIIGPLRYGPSVQNINIFEDRNIDVKYQVRGNVPLIVDSNTGIQRAEINFIFQGIDDINTYVRPLIALFRTVPIVSVFNEMISTAWAPKRDFIIKLTRGRIADLQGKRLISDEAASKIFEELSSAIENNTYDYKYFEKKYAKKPENGTIADKRAQTKIDQLIDLFWNIKLLVSEQKFVPVALEKLYISTIPDLPFSLKVNLSLLRIDISAITDRGYLEYQEATAGAGSIDPKNAFWLKKWLHLLISGEAFPSMFPKITEEDFDVSEIKFYSKNIARLRKLKYEPKPIKFKNSRSRSVAISGGIENNFGFQRIIGRKVPTVQHMGSSSRVLSVDIQTTDDDNIFNDLSSFKEIADEIIRAEDPFDRIFGWEVKSVITKILGGIKSEMEAPVYGIYVPTTIVSNTGEVPHQKNISLKLAETSTKWRNHSKERVEGEGLEAQELKDYFFGRTHKNKIYGLIPADYDYRNGVAEAIELDAHNTVWGQKDSPVDKSRLFGIINPHSFLAALLSRKFDEGAKLKLALKRTFLVSGEASGVPPSNLETMRLRKQKFIDAILSGFKGLSVNDPDAREMATEVKAAMRRLFDGPVPNDFIVSLSNDFVSGITGDTRHLFDLLRKIRTSKYRLSRAFLEGLFQAITKRHKAPPYLRVFYRRIGLEQAFMALYKSYLFNRDIFPPFRSKDLGYALLKGQKPLGVSQSGLIKRVKEDCYPDLPLPTYGVLFGKDWTKFAPTLDELGVTAVVMPDKTQTIGGRQSIVYNSNEAKRQGIVGVVEDNLVSPHVFFFHRRKKDLLRAQLEGASGFLDMLNRHYLSVNILPSTYDFLNKLSDKQLRDIIERGKGAEEYGTLAEAIIGYGYFDVDGSFKHDAYEHDIGFIESKIDELTDSPDSRIVNNQKIYERIYKAILSPSSPRQIAIYFSAVGDNTDNTGGYITTKTQLSPLQAGALLRIIHENRMTIRSRGKVPELLSPAQDAAMMTSVSDRNLTLIRNSKEVAKETLKKTLHHTKDDFGSPKRLWPTVKVYLVERRGTEVFHEDILVSTYSIIKLDITLDKDDADTAVIEIADPFRFLQNSTLASRNVLRRDVLEGDQRDRVLLPPATDHGGYISHLKIKQGRPIVIKMGYSNDPDALDTIFTGRITEFDVGDTITIIAQGWKAEFINRQVSFYSDKTKSWGAKDLAVQAIQAADPDGVGTYYDQADLDLLIENLDKIDPDLINTVLEHQSNSLLTKGDTNIVDEIISWIKGGQSPDEEDTGLDTRLKNIWYPDISKTINNFLYWRQFTGFLPDFVNDYWLVPIQPAWNVLKEAARHTWNYIVDVVPYGNEATVFFGYPDQLYYWTRGDYRILKTWRRAYNAEAHYFDTTNLIQNYISDQLSETIPYPKEIVLVDIYRFKPFYVAYYMSPQRLDISLKHPKITGLHPVSAAGFRVSEELKSRISSYNTFVAEFVRIRKNIKETATRNYDSNIAYIQEHVGEFAIYRLASALFGLAIDKLKFNDFLTRYNLYRTSRDPAVLDADYVNKKDLQKLHPLLDSLFTELLARDRADSLIFLRDTVKNIDVNNYTNTDIDNFLSAISHWVNVVGAATNVVGTAHALSAKSNRVQSIIQQSKALAVSNDTRALLTRLNTRFTKLISFFLEQYSVIVKFTADQKAELLSLINGVIRLVSILKSKKDAIVDDNDLNIQIKLPDGQNSVQSIGDILSRWPEIFEVLLEDFVGYLRRNNIHIEKPRIDTILQHPYMRPFRMHHYVSSKNDIIANNLTVTTAEMWNTVVINHPKDNPADLSTSESQHGLHVGARLSPNASWVYWPKPKNAKVIGLQYHPGITLSNKKIKVCTELNCHSSDLAAKLACNNLAEGIRKMYRGHMIITGRHIRPYDRIYLNDRYTGLNGTIEVESVVHSFSPETGWTTSIIPEAVCDSNPGAAIVQTAIMEETFKRALDLAESIVNIAMWASILLGPLGSVTGAAIKGGSKAVISALKGVFATSIKDIVKNGALKSKALLSLVAQTSKQLLGKAELEAGLGLAMRKAISTGVDIATIYGKSIVIRDLAVGGIFGRITDYMVMSSWAEAARDVKQLPIILAPIRLNGVPWTAGLEADDMLFAVPGIDGWYSVRSIYDGLAAIFGAETLDYESRK